MNKQFLMIVISLFALYSFDLAAQNLSNDIIITKQKEQIQAKVMEIGTDVVKYKRADNIEGPVYSISKSAIVSIMYANGTVDIFGNEVNTVEQPINRVKEADPVQSSTSKTTETTLSKPLIEYSGDSWSGYHFYKDGVMISKSEAYSFISTSTQAMSYWDKAKRNSTWGWILFGFAMGDAVVAGVGLGVGASELGLAFTIEALALGTGASVCLARVNPARKSAASTYNAAVKSNNKVSLNFTSTTNGVGLALNF